MALSEIMLIYPSKQSGWSGAKQHLSRMDPICIDTELLSIRVIAAVCITVASKFAPGHQGSAVHTTVISWSKKHLLPHSFGTRCVIGKMTVKAQREAGFCFGETLTI